MKSEDLAELWRHAAEGVRRSAESLSLQRFPELTERARREAEDFCNLATPKDSNELSRRRTTAGAMNQSWNQELADRSAAEARASAVRGVGYNDTQRPKPPRTT
jgi:hypothetical protein